MSDQTYMVEKGVLVRLRFRTANFTEPHELTEDEALLTDARVVMASMLAELEVAKAREEALRAMMSRKDDGDEFFYCAICRGMGDDNLGPETINHMHDCEFDRLAASEPPGVKVTP